MNAFCGWVCRLLATNGAGRPGRGTRQALVSGLVGPNRTIHRTRRSFFAHLTALLVTNTLSSYRVAQVSYSV
jgi:hypothetical protein